MSRAADGTASLRKGLAVLRAVARSDRAPRFSDLVADTGLPKTTVHRLLAALLEERFLRYDADRQCYMLGLGLFDLARRVWGELEVRKVAELKLQELRDEIGETVHLAVLDDLEVVYIDKYETRESVHTRSTIGARAPAFCTGVGKAILAFLPDRTREEAIRRIRFQQFTDYTITSPDQLTRHLAVVREQGFATDAEEHHIGICCIAAPVFDLRGRVVASVSITAPTFRLNAHGPLPAARSVLNAARAISSLLGSPTPSVEDAAPPAPRPLLGRATRKKTSTRSGR
jgi:DNA-binding IclR family transcriptional regulator